MVYILKETVHKNSRRIWGSFKLSDKSTSKFEMIKGKTWFQWANTAANMGITVDRVTKLCEEYNQE